MGTPKNSAKLIWSETAGGARTSRAPPGKSPRPACAPVDAALAVTRTRDGGMGFEVLRDGLPQDHCYDLGTATAWPSTATPARC